MNADRPIEPDDGGLDPRLAAEFDALTLTPAPDVWSQVAVDAGIAVDELPTRRHSQRQLLAGAIAATVLLVTGVIAAVWLTRGDGASEVVTAAVPPDERLGPILVEPVCAAEGLSSALQAEVATFDHQPSESVDALAARSERIVRGNVLSATAGASETRIDLEVIDAIDHPVEDLPNPLTVSIPSTAVPSMSLRGEVIAFLGGPAAVRPVDAEGLWVACDPGEPAVSVIVTPSAPGWADTLATEPTLDDLWDLVRYPGGSRISELAPALVENGSAIVDVRLAGGDRFRLALPRALADTFTLTERPGPAPLVLEGAESTVTISFQHCPDQRDLEPNLRGALVANRGGVVQLCRPDELLVMTADPDLDLTDAQVDHVDLLPIELGATYGPILRAAWPEYAECLSCTPWGPVVLEEAGVVANRLDATTIAVFETDTLRAVAEQETAAGTYALHGPAPDGGFFVDTIGEGFGIWGADLNARWWIDYRSGEAANGVTGHGDGVWLLRTSFSAEGDFVEPNLRRFDPDDGTVSWENFGRVDARWQPTHPLVVDDVVVVADVLESDTRLADRFGSRLFAFDLDDGELRWSVELDSTPRPIPADAHLLALDLVEGPAIFASGSSGDVVRIDPSTGVEAWRISIPGARLTGLAADPDGSLDVAVETSDGPVRVDPKNREITPMDERAEPFDCPVTEPPVPPFVPPEPWPATRARDDFLWFGTDDLWTVLDIGTSSGRKSVYWSADFPGGAIEARPELEVWYERLDRAGVPVIFAAPGTNAYTPDDGDFMINGVTPVGSGCWQATASYKGATLTYVYEVD